ncbi:MAG: DUF4252 domain-containing protein [Prevotellaceae bacterium]|jgi:hypothetical protein|nr:DUF4252 domain-containing protein [Prevotellaceae bacterium]
MKKIKIILTLLLCTAFVPMSYAQSVQSLFDKYAETDGVTTIYISAAMFRIMPAVGEVSMALTNLKGKIKSLNMLTTEKKELIPQMQKEFSTLVTKKHQELMRVRDGKDRITFYGTLKGEKVDELLMLIDNGEDRTFVILLIEGDFTLQDIQNITKDES